MYYTHLDPHKRVWAKIDFGRRTVNKTVKKWRGVSCVKLRQYAEIHTGVYVGIPRKVSLEKLILVHSIYATLSISIILSPDSLSTILN